MVFFNGYSHAAIFKDSKDSQFQKVYQKFETDGGVRIHWSKMKNILLDDAGAVIPVNKETSKLRAFVGWGLPLGKSFAHWSKETARPSGYAIALQKGSKLKAEIDKW